MTVITLPSGVDVDFEDVSQEDIEKALSVMQEEQPELFDAPQESEEEFVQSLSIEEAREYGRAKGETFASERESSKPSFVPDHIGEVEDLNFQFFYGRADTLEEKAKRIESVFGPNGYQQVEGTDKFALLLDNISPELKKEYDLPESGTMYVNEPGFSWYDVVGVGGAEAGPLTAALGAGLMFTGIGLIPGMILMAGAGAGGKAFDEFVIEDRIEKMNTQSDDEVWGDVAMTGAMYGVGEGLGRGVWALGRRVIKGPGARPDPARIAELVAGGMGRSAATKVAREEAKTELRRAVAAGARPTVSEASQKAILGRMQSIYEGIFPNAAAAAKNLDFVKTTLARLGAGEIDEAAAKQLLSRQSEAISAQVANAMKNANVDDAVRLANQHMQKVIDNEFKVLLDLYNPNKALLPGWKDAANNAARLFEQDSAILYKKAEDLLGRVVDNQGQRAAVISAKPLQDAVKALQADKARVAVMGDAFDTGLFSYIKNPSKFRGPQSTLGDDVFTLTELTSLRSSLRSVSKDPALMPGMNDAAVGKIVSSIDDAISNRLDGLVYLRTDAGRNIAAKFGGTKWDQANTQLFEEGLMAWKKAQKFHASGVKRFKSFSEDLLERNIRTGVLISDKEVLQAVVREGQPDALLRYLKSVTPSGRAAEGIQTVPQSVFDDAARAANSGQFKRANQILDEAGVSDEVVKRLPVFAEKLGVDDPYGRMLASEFSDTIRNLGNLAAARANPTQYRNAMRDSLAREWLQQSYTTSKVAGEFSPTVFASRFDQLGKTADVLFGKKNATALRQLMKDYHKIGMSNKKFADATGEALGATAGAIRSRAMGLTGGRSISDEIANVQSIIREAERQSNDDLFQAIAKGKIDDADSLVTSVLKKPSNYDRLVREFGAELDGPGGVKDMVMGRLMEAAFPQGVLPDVVASGAWGAPLRRQISNLNRNGALAKVLGDGNSARGQTIVNDLVKASKIGERISDQSLRGKQGLASAAFAAGAGMRLITDPLSFVGEAIGIFTLGRVMRQKWFLNSLLQPRYSAGLFGMTGGRRLLQKGRRAGADLEGVSPLGLELRERIAQEARMMAASLHEQGVGSDTRKDMQEAVSFVRGNIKDLQNQVIPVSENMANMAQGNVPEASQARQVLEQVERNKLLGVSPTQ
jgi:hypothetical protein